jgi:hypothetical protein
MAGYSSPIFSNCNQKYLKFLVLKFAVGNNFVINPNQKYLKFPLTLPLSPAGRGRG